MNKNPKNKKLENSQDSIFDRIAKHQWENASVQGINDAIGSKIWSKLQTKIEKQKTIWQYIKYTASIAACITLILILVPYLNNNIKEQHSPFAEFTTLHFTEPSSITLPDSSTIWIQSNSSIKFSNDFENRIVWVAGNALFDVVRVENNKPFRVYTDEGVYIEVKGTTFSVKNENDISSVTLHTGTVDFVVEELDQKLSLQNNQKAIYNQSLSELSLTDINLPKLEDGYFKFKDTDIKDLMLFIEETYSCQIALQEEHQDSNYKFTGVLKFTDSLDSVLEKVSYAFDLKYQKEDDTNQIFF